MACLVDVRLPNSKFAGDPAATLAFQKVSLAYSVLADPARRRRYDASPTEFAAQGMGGARAEETLRGVVLGVFNDFLDNGDLEVIRNMLSESNFHLFLHSFFMVVGTVRLTRTVQRHSTR